MRRDALILLLASAVLVALRLHAFDLPLETDECNYAYIGARLLDGDRLYLDVWDHQPPGVFMLFAGAIALFGDAPLVFRALSTGFSLASLCLIYAILRHVAGRPTAALGAILFAIVSSDPGTGGEGCNREIFMNTLILAAWYFALRSSSGHGITHLSDGSQTIGSPDAAIKAPPLGKGGLGGVIVAGFLLAIASLLKTNVAVHWMFLAVWLAIHAAHGAKRGRWVRRVGTTLVGFALGPALVWAATFAYFAATGRFHDFLDAAFLFNLGYTDVREPFLMRFWRFFAPPRHPFIFESALPLWLLTIPAAAWLLVRSMVRRDKESPAILILLFASYVATCLPGRFWPHYYYLLIPALVLVVASAAGDAVRAIAVGPGRIEQPATIVGSVVGVLLSVVVGIAEYRDYLSQPPLGITKNRYNTRDFWGRAQGENVARVTKPEDAVFVFGNDAEIYYYAKRRCASRYTMITGLQKGMRGADRRRQILMSELRAAPPRLIVLLFDEEPFDEWKAFLDDYYGQPVGWDLHDKTRKPIMFVLARKDRPIESINWDWDRSQIGGFKNPPHY